MNRRAVCCILTLSSIAVVDVSAMQPSSAPVALHQKNKNGKQAVLEKLKKRQEDRSLAVKKQLEAAQKKELIPQQKQHLANQIKQASAALNTAIPNSVFYNNCNAFITEKKEELRALNALPVEDRDEIDPSEQTTALLAFCSKYRTALAGAIPATIALLIAGKAHKTAQKYRHTTPDTDYEKWLIQIDKYLRNKKNFVKALAGTVSLCILAATCADLAGHDSCITAPFSEKNI